MKRLLVILGVVCTIIIVGSILYSNFFTGLNACASSGNTGRLEKLIQKAHNEEVKKALIYAIANRQAGAVKVLLQSIDSPDYKADSNYTPLMIAAAKGDNDTIKLLLDKGASVDYSVFPDEKALTSALVQGKVDSAIFLLKRGAGIHCILQLDFIPQEISEDKMIELMGLLIEKGADVRGEFGVSALRNAVRIKGYKLLGWLMDQGVPARMPAQVFEWICKNNDTKMLDYLLTKGACGSTDEVGEALSTALTQDNMKMFKYLIRKGIPLDRTDPKGILSETIRKGDTEAVKMLIQRGIDVGKNIQKGKSVPLVEAVMYCNPEVVKLLLDQGALVKLDQKVTTIFDVLNITKDTRIEWFDFGHKKDCDRIGEMLQKSKSIPVNPERMEKDRITKALKTYPEFNGLEFHDGNFTDAGAVTAVKEAANLSMNTELYKFPREVVDKVNRVKQVNSIDKSYKIIIINPSIVGYGKKDGQPYVAVVNGRMTITEAHDNRVYGDIGTYNLVLVNTGSEWSYYSIDPV